MEFLALREAAAEKAWQAAQRGAGLAIRNQAEAQRLVTDLEAQVYVAPSIATKCKRPSASPVSDAGSTSSATAPHGSANWPNRSTISGS